MHFVIALVLAMWALALLRTIVNLVSVPRLTAAPPASEPFLSVIIPARNEERTIEPTIRALFAQTYQAFEVIVVDDRSTDSTPQILAALAGDPRLILIRGEEPPDGWLGKSWALQRGSERARGDLMLFMDADLHYAPDTLRAAVAASQRTGASMITLLPHFEMRGFWENAAMPQLAMFAFTIFPLWLSNRSRSPGLAIGGGSGNLIGRVDYNAIGGHVALRDAVVDDVALARLARRNGLRTFVVRGDAHISVRMYHGLAEIVDGFTKNFFFVLGRSYIAAALGVAGMIVFHLVPYGLALAGNALSIATVIVIAVTRLILFRSLRYRLDNALLLHPVMILIWMWIAVRSVWYTGIRGQLAWRGRTYDANRSSFGAGRRDE